MSERRSESSFRTDSEITPDDVQIVLDRFSVKADADVVFDSYIRGEYRVQMAALQGNDLDERTDFALEEIAAVLIENGVISRPC